MPKVLILLPDRAGQLARIADAIAEGAESVKFTEVELRRVGGSPQADGNGSAAKYRKLESWQTIADYDAVIIGLASTHSATELDELLTGDGKPFVDKVASLFGAIEFADAVLGQLLRAGMILVGPSAGADDLTTGRRQGVRAAKVAEWVRHAKSHSHSHSH